MTYHHLSVLVHRQAEKYGDKVALKYRDYETAQWIPISWKQFSGSVRQAANAFVALGVEEQENIGIFSQNKPEWFYVDFGAFANRAVTIPFYATSSPAQAQYIIKIDRRYVAGIFHYRTVKNNQLLQRGAETKDAESSIILVLLAYKKETNLRIINDILRLRR